jgi:hypothetical protein
MKPLAQVLKETKLGVAMTPKSQTSCASGRLGHANMPRGFTKHEVKHGVEELREGSHQRGRGTLA